MKRLFKYFGGYIKECILGPLFKLLEATLELIVPLIVALIVDYGIDGEGGTGFALWMSLVLVGFGAVGLLFSVVAQYFSAKAAVGFTAKVRAALFSKIQELSYSDIDTLGTSTMITRMTQDASKVQNGVNLALRLLLRSPFVVFGAMIMAFIIDPTSATSFAVVIPILSVIVFGIMLITMPLYKRTQKGNDALVSKTRENLSGVRVIRAFRLEEDEVNGFLESNDTLTRVQKRVGMISSLLNPLTFIIINLAILWLMELGAIQVEGGALTSGQVIALYNLMSQILVELIKLANLIISISRALASASRIADVLDYKSTETSGTVVSGTDGAHAVEFDNVTLKYNGAGEPSLTDISFIAERGETIGIIGGTGSGKTSLINMIPGFYPAASGTVLIDGVDVNLYDRDAITEMVGIVPQKAVLFSGTIRDNMRFCNKNATDEEIYRALDIAMARSFVEEKGGLDAVVEEGGSNFSGGQRQRLTIARAIVGSPKILILDDSASALDYATDASLRKNLRTLGGITTFIVSQRTSSIMHADRIIVLEDGEMVGIGTHEELLQNSDIYREIYSSQYSEGVTVNG